MQENKKKISVLIISVCLVLVLIVGISYAYFSRSGVSNARTVQAGTLRIQYADDNTNTVTLNNIAPIYDADIQTKANKIGFTVTNTGTSLAYVSIGLTDMVIPNELKNSDFKWALYSGNTKIKDGNFSGATTPMNLIKNETIASQASKSYQLFIWISETGQEQNTMMNKTFSANILIEGSQYEVASPKLLTQKIIEDNSPVTTTKPTFINMATTDEGLIKDVDSDGDTYYFRGNVKDNYLKVSGLRWTTSYSKYILVIYGGDDWMEYDTEEAAISDCLSNEYYFSEAECRENIVNMSHNAEDEMLFKIVRINGDGTTRVILNGNIGTSAYDIPYKGHKSVGYTYDNGKSCTPDSPCTSNTGTSSTIKTYLENWYSTNIANNANNSKYDNIFATSRFCNDTTGEENDGQILYGPYNRLDTEMEDSPGTLNGAIPTFICPTTNKTYGGEYILKIGLLTLDEAVAAGGKTWNSNFNFYLAGISNEDWWTASPYYSNSYNAYMYSVAYDGVLDFGPNVNGTSGSVVPVFNISSNIQYFEGDGTKSNPYVVKVD